MSFAEQQRRRGRYYDQSPFPFVPGYDLVGVVVRVGAGVDASLIGRRLAPPPRRGPRARRDPARLPGGRSARPGAEVGARRCRRGLRPHRRRRHRRLLPARRPRRDARLVRHRRHPGHRRIVQAAGAQARRANVPLEAVAQRPAYALLQHLGGQAPFGRLPGPAAHRPRPRVRPARRGRHRRAGRGALPAQPGRGAVRLAESGTVTGKVVLVPDADADIRDSHI